MSDKKNRIEKTIIAVLSICCVICVIIIICNLDFYFPGLNTGDPSSVTAQENTTEYNPSVITDYPWKESTSGSLDSSSAAVGVSSGDMESGKTDNSGASDSSGIPGKETGRNIPEKTASPDTTAVFVSDTTSKSGQTDAAETTRKQNETVPTHTTSAPERTIRPETTSKPWQTIAPVTTKRPEQTTSPVTTSKPKTSAPETTKTPVTTKTPTTTKTPETTKTPVTTKPVSPETTVEIPESYPVPDDVTTGIDLRDVLIAPNGDIVTGVWKRYWNSTEFIVDIPELEMFTPYEWWGWDSNYNTLVWGYYVKTSWATVGFKPEVQLPPKQGTGTINTEVRTVRPGTWW